MESIIVLPLGVLGASSTPLAQLPHPWVWSRVQPGVSGSCRSSGFGLLGRGDVSTASAVAAVWVLALALTAWSAIIFGSGRLKA